MSIGEQIRAMAAVWPQMQVTGHTKETAVWRGNLRPLLKAFEVQIAYRAPLVVEMPNMRRLQPRVRIVTPTLRPRPGDPEGELPHVYYIGDGPTDVVLCMFDPETDEWSPEMSLAETTVPWTIDWLTSYEGWRATGEWTGGGRHVERPRLEGAAS